jgi:hypothetical protein
MGDGPLISLGDNMGKRKPETPDTDMRYFSKVQEGFKGSREMAFHEAFVQTINRAKATGSFILARKILSRILNEADLERIHHLPYYSLVNAMTSATMRDASKEELEAILRKYKDKLEPGIVDEIGEIFGL